MGKLKDQFTHARDKISEYHLKRQRAELSKDPANPVVAVAEAIFDHGVTPKQVVDRAAQLFDAAYDPGDKNKLSVYMGSYYFHAADAAKRDFDADQADLRRVANTASPIKFCRAIQDSFANTGSETTRRRGLPYKHAAQLLIDEAKSQQASKLKESKNGPSFQQNSPTSLKI